MSGSSHRRFPSPLRYPGGKGKVANYIKLVLLENDLVGRQYVEPYAGGASVALSLLFGRYVGRIHVNDLDRSVHAFWRVVLDRPDELCSLIRETPVTMEERTRQQAIQQGTDPDELELAFSTFFLNRTSRSGIIGGGVIGGRGQTGRWKIDARFNREDLIIRVQKIARFGSLITLTGMDTAEYLRTVLPTIDDPVVYLDPPYYVKGEGLYENAYQHEDHEEIAAVVRRLDVPWIVSYDAAPAIVAMYEGCEALFYDLAYSAADRYRGDEVMFFSSQISPPQDVLPCKVGSRQLDEVRMRGRNLAM